MYMCPSLFLVLRVVRDSALLRRTGAVAEATASVDERFNQQTRNTIVTISISISINISISISSSSNIRA